MDNNKFFKFVWRANALLLLGAALLAFGSMVFVIVLDISRHSNNYEKPPMQTDADSPAGIGLDDLKIRKTSVKFGNGLLYLELEKPGYSGGSLSYSRSITYNVGIHSLVSNETNWVFSSNHQEIKTAEHFYKTEPAQNGETEKTVMGHLFSSLTTDKEGEIHRDIWVTDIFGHNRKKILSGVEDEPTIWYYGDNKAKLIIETDKRVQLIDFDLFTREIGDTVFVEPPK